MKRSRDCGSNPAMQGFQSRKGVDGLWVTNDARNGTSAGRICRLPLGWGLGLRHGSGRNQVRNGIDISRLDGHFMADGELRHQHAVAAQFADNEAAQLVAGFKDFAELHNVANFHFAAPALCVGESSHITSDVSTTVRRVARRLLGLR